MLVNLSTKPGEESRMVEMSPQEAQDWWTKQIVPPRLLNKVLANGKAITSEFEAYWASQPGEVQVLMYITTEAKRLEKAHELADQGFLIDVPIMVWGWDPLSTMVVRRNQGYTWVPSAKQEPVRVAPGVNFPGLPGYDPKNPPPGSIKVTTEWARGFEKTSPWPVEEEPGKPIIF